MEIREVRDDEVDALGELTVAAYDALPELDVGELYRASLRDVASRARDAVVLVAVDDDGTLLGGVTYVSGPGPYAEFEADDEAGIRMLAVAPAAQRRGAGTALVRACVERARAAGRARVSLHTMATMTTAQRMYERLGFRRAPERDETYDWGTLLSYVLGLDARSSWGRRDSNPH